MSSADSYEYEGSELALFAQANNWKAYLRSTLEPYVRGEVLEVGAGVGGTTRALSPLPHQSWVCLEPDEAMTRELRASLDGSPAFRVVCGDLSALGDDETFDTILYIDVLEHIEADVAEARRAEARLRPGGRLVVLCPAHQFLFTPFDAAIGHHRRYDARRLRAVAPASLELERCIYLDAVGMLASLGNKLLLRSAMPTAAQIQLWDRIMVPISTRVDGWLGHRVGKSVLAVWRRPEDQRRS